MSRIGVGGQRGDRAVPRRDGLAQAQRYDAAQAICWGYIEALPLPDACVDLAWSNLAVRWCDDLRAAAGELYRVAPPAAEAF